MRIAIAQMNATVGDLAGNVDRILDFSKRARTGGASVVITPELAVCGYPPEDLLLRDEFMESCAHAVEELARRAKGITLIVGHPRREACLRYNSASVLRDGAVVRVYDKRSLPSYTVFDEARYFDSASRACVFALDNPTPAADSAEVDSAVQAHGNSAGINICADTWDADSPRAARAAGARILLVLNASPYHLRKQEMRRHVMRERAAETGLAAVYVNMVGGQDELVFDGASFVMDADGEITQQLPAFEEALGFVDIADGVPMSGPIAPRLAPEAEVYKALVLGLRDYVIKNGFPGVVLGVSGEIESALTLAIAVDAIGASRVRALMMPSQHTPAIRREDARAQALAMGVRYSEIAIGDVARAYEAALSSEVSPRADAEAGQSLSARVRGTLLVALARETGAIVLATCSKTDMAIGDATLQGHMTGGFAVLKDIDKMLVYTLADYRNGVSRVIPQAVIDRTVAQARGERVDGALPPYPVLDAILAAYVEDDLPPAQIIARGYAPADVERVLKLVQSSEYQRRQAPIGVRITGRAFGKDWRYPITNRFRHSF
jgi:NAD+ synthetase